MYDSIKLKFDRLKPKNIIKSKGNKYYKNN